MIKFECYMTIRTVIKYTKKNDIWVRVALKQNVWTQHVPSTPI